MPIYLLFLSFINKETKNLYKRLRAIERSMFARDSTLNEPNQYSAKNCYKLEKEAFFGKNWFEFEVPMK
jgi:hypothetical protein